MIPLGSISPLKMLHRIRAQPDASVISVQLADIYAASLVAATIRGTLGNTYTTIDWQEANRPLFAALALERRMGLFIIALIIFIAALNITTTLILVVIERRRDIGILSAMGAGSKSIMGVFMIEGAMIGVIGALTGVMLGSLACLVGNRYRLVSLPADVYSISNVPFNPTDSGCGACLGGGLSIELRGHDLSCSSSQPRSTRGDAAGYAISPMSKVQRPTSQIDGWPLSVQSRDPDVGQSILDFGLSVADLRKSFSSPVGDRIDVLRGVSFSARPGQTVAIMGASGAGKSTLLHLLGGLEAPDHGKIVLGNFEIDCAPATELVGFRNKNVGFIFQFHHLLPDLSASENVAMPLIIARTRRHEAMTRAIRALDNVALGARIDHPVGQLSGGERQRVAVCRALIAQPSLVLADEPTGNLDESFVEDIGQTLVTYARSRRAIVIVATHNEDLAHLCDRIFVLTDGKVSPP